jgi:RsiW-degrading membrane proteinase PrsW (M82 family)
MTWRRRLQATTRNEQFLWRMVIAILAAGMVVGAVVDWAVPPWVNLEPELAGEPELAPAPMPEGHGEWRRVDEMAASGDWWGVFRAIPRTMVRGWRHAGLTALAVLTGACWLAFLLQAVQIRGWRDVRLWAPLAGVALGVLSIWPTLFFLEWQEYRWGLAEGGNWAEGIRFFIAGVGLREEVAKLICFLPLLPFLVRARDELAALVSAACVGIGFAMEENIQYIAGSLGTDTLGRMLMPAPFHMAMTGLAGLAAYRACRWPREWGPQFVALFGVIILGHALYDALQAVAELRELSLGSYVIFVLMMYQFFHELRPLRSPRVDTISLTANFLFCVSVAAAATFVYLSAAAGWRLAGIAQGQSIVAQAVMVYLFLREMPETMVRV